MRIAVVGTGYVGLVTGVVLADLGNSVVCVDRDEAKLERLRAGVSPIHEPGIEELLSRTMKAGRLEFTSSISEAVKGAEVLFIAVGTPQGADGEPDMSAVRAVAAEVGKSIQGPLVVVNKSTVPVGSGGLVEQLILDQGADPALVDVVSNPEFLREGSAIQDTLHPDRIVIGAKNPEAAEALVRLYRPLNAPFVITDLESAELIKYAANSFLAAKISFVNALSRICEKVGGNIDDVSRGMGLDRRIGPDFLQAGLGWGGSCFPKDVRALALLADRLGCEFGMLKEAEEVNRTQTLLFLDRMREALGGFEGKKVALLGLAFKPNTDDIRDAKSLVMIERFLAEGAQVSAYDPVAWERVRELEPRVAYATGAMEAAEGADCVVLVTEWNEFRQLDLRRLASVMARPLLFDGRRVYRRSDAEAAGFEYHTIGG